VGLLSLIRWTMRRRPRRRPQRALPLGV